jgi:hypothetical protein
VEYQALGENVNLVKKNYAFTAVVCSSNQIYVQGCTFAFEPIIVPCICIGEGKCRRFKMVLQAHWMFSSLGLVVIRK